MKILLNKKRSSLRPFPLAGAEGLEPSARGFGAAVESSKLHRQATIQAKVIASKLHFRGFDAFLMLLVFFSLQYNS